MTTQLEVERLKHNWLGDPCWDIENTLGFEEHKNELKLFRLETEAHFRNAENDRVRMKCKELGCTPELLKYIESLEYKVARLEDKEYNG